MDARKEELLCILQEEAAEVIQAVSKMRRFGETDHNSDNLITEIGDFMGVLKALVEDGNFTEDEFIKAAEAKEIKLEKYMTNKKATKNAA